MAIKINGKPITGITFGVTSFNGRSGAIAPQAGDYTADMVGAVTMEQVQAAIQAALAQVEAQLAEV